ncbi:MAG: ORC1-type DNA replication protein 2 [Candidatus Methanofastidiosum methylothiophilum]|uniref:ORC1-type DNA replication protein n=1 Tax=Candidatus Methanofastidiosum methylothiophilum TaxID=1705564 RepID=A0A150IT39_9EURY|nr:MAG: ORC1-type DNA replication protein 2 [Candidatus Methanofastidiosum methylthiophilus]KYC48136.1 MAG: ORC1-type DNA replication protein 2 [Candidatus Methanofastidiosum methylthiophilus]KYC50625.1 MAG: ORC1-type DNA replication protein 2 [Candidatus Methanofastidiosum methylthiophilus]
MSSKIKDILMWDESLFRNPEVFDLSYIPEVFKFRDNEIEAISHNVKPLIKGDLPTNTIILGPTGTGKTTSVKLLFREINEVSNEVIPVYINCQFHYREFSIMSQIFRGIFGYPPVETGKPLTTLYEYTMGELQKKGKRLLVALDDVDFLFHVNIAESILYKILRAHEIFPGVKTGIIGIVTDNAFSFKVSEKIRTVFMPNEVHFKPYSQSTISEILRYRCDIGLYPGVMDNDVLDKISEITFDRGDLRLGIRAIKEAGMLAELGSRKKITTEDVEKAIERISSSLHVENVFDGLSKTDKKVLKVIAENSGKFTKANDFFNILADEMSYELFRKATTKLENLKIVDIQRAQSRGRGKQNLIHLRVPKEAILEIIKE